MDRELREAIQLLETWMCERVNTSNPEDCRAMNACTFVVGRVRLFNHAAKAVVSEADRTKTRSLFIESLRALVSDK